MVEKGKSTVKKLSQGYGYTYTELSTIHEELERQGITYYQYIDYDANADADYIYTVIDDEKPRRGCRAVIGTEAKMSAAQAQGSAITYARRYSLLMALGWATEDDDGAGAGNKPKQSYGRGRIDFKEIRDRVAQIDSIDELNKYWHELRLSDKQASFVKDDFAKRKVEIGGENGLE